MKLKYLSILILFVAGLYSCEEEPVGQQPSDRIPPGTVTDVRVTNIPGGAIFHYTPPGDEDLLYVKAVYSLKNDGVLSETKASVYADSLRIVGFGDTIEHQVKLIAVDRSKNESPEIMETVIPLKPDVLAIAETVSVVADFGGIYLYWNNSNKAAIAVFVLLKDHNEEYVPLETFYSSTSDGDGVVKGMDTIPYDFSVYVQDRWDNQSVKKYYNLTPLYETTFDRFKFKSVILPGDAPAYPNWGIENLWNNSLNEPGYSSIAGSGGWPHSITIDLGVTGKISGIKLFQRRAFPFAEGNVRRFEIWGCETLDYSGSWDSWIKMADCVSVKPSGLPMGQNTDEDIYVANNGELFNIPSTIPKVRYIRLKVLQNWQNGDNFQIVELEFYGDNR